MCKAVDEARTKLRSVDAQAEHGHRLSSITTLEVVQDVRVETEAVGELAGLEGVDGFRSAKAQSLRAGRHAGRSELMLDGVDSVSRHLAVGRQLAPGDGDEPGRRSLDLVTSGEVGGARARGRPASIRGGEQGS